MRPLGFGLALGPHPNPGQEHTPQTPNLFGLSAKRFGAGGIAAWPIREYLPTIATELTALVSQILAYKMAAHYLGQTGFSEYAVARRTVSLLSPLTLLGLGVGLPRYIAYSKGRGEKAVAGYFVATLCIVGSATLLCVSLLNLAPGCSAFLFFGQKNYAPLIFPLSLMVLGASLHSAVYAYFRGELLMLRANLLQLANMAVVPLLSFFVPGNSAQKVMLSLGVIWATVASTALLFTPMREARSSLGNEARQLLRYGIQRMPGDFILMALLTVPVTLAAHRNGMQEAGFVAFGISVLSMIGALFTPIGLILLPKASTWLADGRFRELRAHVIHLVQICVVVSGAATAAVWLSASSLIKVYLGSGFAPAALALRWIVLGAVPYVLFAVLRNLIDAFHRNAITALISAGAFSVFGVAAWLGRTRVSSGEEVLAALLLGLMTLGVAASWECVRILRSTCLQRRDFLTASTTSLRLTGSDRP